MITIDKVRTIFSLQKSVHRLGQRFEVDGRNSEHSTEGCVLLFMYTLYSSKVFSHISILCSLKSMWEFGQRVPTPLSKNS